MATIFETIAQKVKGIVPQFLDEDKIKTDPQGAQVLESAQRLGEKVKEKLGKPLAESLPAVKTGVFNVFEIISRVAGAAVQRLPGILQVPEEEREPFVPKTGETFMEAIRRQPSFGFEFGERKGVVEAAVEKGPLGGVPFLAPVIGFLSELLLPPYGPKGANIVDDLAKITSKLETKGVLLKGIKEISEKEADDLAVKLAPITDKKIIRQELDTFAKSKAEIAQISPKIAPELIIEETQGLKTYIKNADTNDIVKIFDGGTDAQRLTQAKAFIAEQKIVEKVKVKPVVSPTIEIKTKAPAYKRVLNQGYITTKDSWGNEFVQIRGKVPEIVKEKGVAPHS